MQQELSQFKDQHEGNTYTFQLVDLIEIFKAFITKAHSTYLRNVFNNHPDDQHMELAVWSDIVGLTGIGIGILNDRYYTVEEGMLQDKIESSYSVIKDGFMFPDYIDYIRVVHNGIVLANEQL